MNEELKKEVEQLRDIIAFAEWCRDETTKTFFNEKKKKCNVFKYWIENIKK